MTTQTLTLTDFLLARIAEDEAEARHRDVVTFGPEQRAVAGVQGAFDPARVLAECEAKRRIVELHRGGAWPHPADPCDAHDASGRTIPCDTLRLLALPYTDHPGHREEWRP